MGIHETSHRLGPVALDGFDRGLLRQRDDRVVLVTSSAPAAGPPKQPCRSNCSTGNAGRRRIELANAIFEYLDLPQPNDATPRLACLHPSSSRQVELLDRQRWKTRIELANAIFEYLEIFHNRQRRHSALGMLTPIEFETRYQPTTAA